MPDLLCACILYETNQLDQLTLFKLERPFKLTAPVATLDKIPPIKYINGLLDHPEVFRKGAPYRRVEAGAGDLEEKREMHTTAQTMIIYMPVEVAMNDMQWK
jgi:hypothetical protein